MPGLKHLVLTNSRPFGFAYGMLHDFEAAIVAETGAERVEAPPVGAFVARKLGHGMRFGRFRTLVPRRRLPLEADVVWTVVMGPEDCDLDLCKDWDRGSRVRILYVYDTFRHQVPALRRILGAGRWTFAVTSFPAAVPFLEKATRHPWRAVPQGVSPERFLAGPSAAERPIAFSALGRKLDGAHEAANEFSRALGKLYVTSMPAEQLEGKTQSAIYDQYADTLRRSTFTISWPVELTNPERSRDFPALTCRWFEAAASGTPIIGRAPADPTFDALVGRDAIVEISGPANREAVARQLPAIWERRDEYVRRAIALRAARIESWSWRARVREILSWLGERG